MIKNNRKFGVEIEMYPENGAGHACYPSYVANLLRAAGINAQDSGYTHDDSDTVWKVVTDSSCGMGDFDHRGIEVVSPRLSGEQGLEDLKKVCEVLHSAGMKIKKSCGLHVHTDAGDLSQKELAAIVATYARYEKFFDLIQPESRRNNGMCKSVTNVLSMSDYEKRTYVHNPFDCFHGDRYHKVNLQSYQRHGTVEFRQHSGTIEAGKIIPWVLFLINFVEITSRWTVNCTANKYTFSKIMRALKISAFSSDSQEKEVYDYVAGRFSKFSDGLRKNTEI